MHERMANALNMIVTTLMIVIFLENIKVKNKIQI